MFRQISPDGKVIKEKMIPQLDGNEAPRSKNEPSQSGQGPASSEEAATEMDQPGSTTTKTPHTPMEAADEHKNLKLAEEGVNTKEKGKPTGETDPAADPVQQSGTHQLNAWNQELVTEPTSSLQSDKNHVIATGTTTKLTELPTSHEPNQQVHEETKATTSVPEPHQPPTPIFQSKIEPLVQPLESGASVITPSNDANNNNPQTELIPHLEDKSSQQQCQQQQEVDRSGGQPPLLTNSILSEREKAKPEQSSSKIIASSLEERLRKLEARLARLEFMERFAFDCGESGKGAGAGALGSAAVATLDKIKEAKEGREKEDTIQVTTDAQDNEEEENEKSRTATRINGNRVPPAAAEVTGAGCPFLNRA